MDQSKYIAELERQVARQSEQIAQLSEQLTLALLRIQELELRLKKNSSNSDKPPSSDGLSKKPAIPRQIGQRKPGGQKGHPGKTLKMVADPDRQVVHPIINQRCECGCDLIHLADEGNWERRQVFDLPPTVLEVTEHRLEQKTCPDCKRLHVGQFPEGVNSRVQYGERVRALSVLLNVEQSLPLWRVQELFAGLTGYAINESTVNTSVKRMSDELAPEEQIIHQAVLDSPVAHADETGGRIAGSTHWIHGFSSLLHTLYVVCKPRGGEVINGPESHLANYTGRLIHDCLNSYLAMNGSLLHGLCNAHLLRELTALMEHPQALSWPGQMHKLLMDYYRSSDYGKGVVSQAELKKLDDRYAIILALADREEPPPKKGKRGRPKKSAGRNLMDRFKAYEEAVLAFSRHAEVPFTNNLGERDLRPWKTKLKVSGCFRTLEGARRYARIKGFCSTVKKNGLVVFDQLIAAQKGQSFLRLA